MTDSEESLNVFIAGDTGPSGFGVATKGLIKQLLKTEGVNVTVHTHEWGWNSKGEVHSDEGRRIGDTRFKQFIIQNGYINDDYMTEGIKESMERQKSNPSLTEDLGDNRSVDSERCMVRQFEGKEDVWIAIGGQNFAEHAPSDDSIHTILSTDFNLSLVPRDWEYYLKQVDEVWVPSKWTYNSIKNRFEDTRPEIVDKTYWMHYGINMDYRPTDYDCEACPNRHMKAENGIEDQPCLNDDKFNFLVVSRFYHIKGVYRTLKAYIQEFDRDEDVRLFFKTTANKQFSFNPMKTVKKVIEESGKSQHPEVGLKKKPFDSQHMYDLYGHADTFIQASRAECFGIAQVQAAYCGTPVIYTDWSSQREVMNESLPGMKPLKQYTVERPEQESQALMFSGVDDYPVDSEWATPDVKALQKRMREMFETSEDERRRMGQKNKEYVEDNFDWSEKIKPRLKRIREGAREVEQ